MLGCQAPTPSATAPASAPSSATHAPAHVSAPLDIGATIARVQLAFRREADGFHGGGAAFRTTATPNGRAFVTARDTAPFSIETVGAAPRSVLLAPDGSVAIDRGAAVEILRNQSDGLEQSWRFARRPETPDLQVTVRVAGLEYAGATTNGLHFRDGARGRGVRYGVATWIDAAGQRVTVSAAYQDGAISLHVPAEVLDRSAYPALLDPIISSEIGIDTPVVALAATDERAPRVAFDGTNYLVVYTDDRPLAPGYYATRVGPTGTVLDPDGILVAAQSVAGSGATVVWAGSHYLVVFVMGNNVLGVRVRADGRVLDTTPFLINTPGYPESVPNVAFDGTNSLVVWQVGGLVQGVRVDFSGAALDTIPLAIASGARAPLRPTPTALAFDGTSYWVG
jgi:hypothetical protein